ncbi:hypothetical protein PABG_11818 [Paracoccidioides brasiliensis Pb03]|nr:hypothetical protein PABG_11818 [Paracoccidioides brasiliensis Pb03]
MNIDHDDYGSDIEWIRVEGVDEEMPDAASPNNGSGDGPFSGDGNGHSNCDCHIVDATDDSKNPQLDSGYGANRDSTSQPPGSDPIPAPSSMQPQPTNVAMMFVEENFSSWPRFWNSHSWR